MNSSNYESMIISESGDAGNQNALTNVDRIDLLGPSQRTGNGATPASEPSELDLSESIYPAGTEQPMLLADVIVHGPGDGQVPGHRSIEVTNSILGRMNYSFATDNALAPSFGTGRVYFDADGLSGRQLERIQLTPEQDRMVLDYIQNSGWDGSRYSLTNRNCQTFVNEVANFARNLRR